MDDIEDEIRKVDEEIKLLNKSNETQTEKDEIIEKPKRKGQSRERMMELHKIRSEKARLKREEREEIKTKAEEVKNIKKEILNTELEEARKIKEALEAKKEKKNRNKRS